MFGVALDFDEALLCMSAPENFKDASVFYTTVAQIQEADLARWLNKSRNIQWDYKMCRQKKRYFRTAGNNRTSF